MAGSPAPVEAYTIEGYDDAPAVSGRTIGIVAGVGVLVAAAAGLVYVLVKSDKPEPLPYHPPTSWATE